MVTSENLNGGSSTSVNKVCNVLLYCSVVSRLRGASSAVSGISTVGGLLQLRRKKNIGRDKKNKQVWLILYRAIFALAEHFIKILLYF